jgi:endonuclease III
VNAVVVPGSVDLDLSLYLSFTLPMFTKRGVCWVKEYGFGRGSILCSDGGVKCYGEGCSETLVTYLAGLWIDKDRALELVEGRAREVAEDVVSRFYCLGVPASPWDTFEVLTTAFLSRKTDYHTNTVRWVRLLLSYLSLEQGPTLEGVLRCSERVYREFHSYQLLQYHQVVREIYAVSSMARAVKEVDKLRMELVKIRYVGPKVADSFILHVGLDPSKAPVDVHYMRFLKRWGLLRGSLTVPSKVYCSRYSCSNCPLAPRCVSNYASTLFRSLNGFIQSAAYVADKLGITRCEDMERVRHKLV